MCGVAGYLQLQEKETSGGVIGEMLRLQRHRGPDDSGIVGIDLDGHFIEELDESNGAGWSRPVSLIFGFNRLSILDLSRNGHQPMVDSDRQVVLMMNGEIYNAFEYQSGLVAKGHVFKSKSDTEVALKLYLEYGIEGMLRRLNGMFAFAIADLRLGKLFLVRDRFGIKPLYLRREANRISFSSEIKSFKALPGNGLELDPELLSEFLLFRNLVNRTLFKGVVNITPGTYVEIDSRGACNVRKFYDLVGEGGARLSGKAAFDALDESLSASVSRQMLSDVKLGCQLSGGVDSSMVSHYARQAVACGQLETVSVVFDNERFSEKRYIDYVSDALSLKSHQFVLDENYYFNAIESAAWHFEQPLNHPNTMGIYLLSQRAKDHVTVLLSGEGADETLAGYDRFVSHARGAYRLRPLFYGLYKNRRRLISFLRYYGDANMRLVMGSAFGTIANSSDVYADFDFERAITWRLDVLRSIVDESIRRHRKYEMLTYMPDLLMRQDKMSMAHSIENRVPFLDNEMVSTSLSIADGDLVAQHNGELEGKKLLKDLCSRQFSEAFAYRQKMGFSIPLRQFFQSDAFHSKWQEDVFPNIRNRGIFDSCFVERVYRNVETTDSAGIDILWLMFGFELWAKQYLD